MGLDMSDVNAHLRLALQRLTWAKYKPLVLKALQDHHEMTTLEVTHYVERQIGRPLRRPIDPLLIALSKAGVLAQRREDDRTSYWKLEGQGTNRKLRLLFGDD